jgi:hypothetical protein
MLVQYLHALPVVVVKMLPTIHSQARRHSRQTRLVRSVSRNPRARVLVIQAMQKAQPIAVQVKSVLVVGILARPLSPAVRAARNVRQKNVHRIMLLAAAVVVRRIILLTLAELQADTAVIANVILVLQTTV